MGRTKGIPRAKTLHDFKAPSPEANSMAEFYYFCKDLLANEKSTCDLEMPTLEDLQAYFERAGVFHGVQKRLYWPQQEPPKPRPSPKYDEFHRFMDLPIELRLQIWEAALPDPRIVVMSVYEFKYYIGFVKIYEPGNVETYTSLFDACDESFRVVASNYSRPQLASHQELPEYDREPSDVSFSLAPGIVHGLPFGSDFDRLSFPRFGNVDCRRDTLLIKEIDVVRLKDLEFVGMKIDLSRVRNLAICFLVDRRDHLESVLKMAALVFPAIKTLRIVMSLYGDEDDLHISFRRDTVRLIELNHDFQSLAHTSGLDQNKAAGLFNCAEDIRGRLKQFLATNKTIWKSLHYEVTIEGVDVNREAWHMGLVEFPPLRLKGQKLPLVLHTYKPICIASERQIVFDLGGGYNDDYAFYECSKDGSLISRYDGIEQMFSETLKIEDDNTLVSKTKSEEDGLRRVTREYPGSSFDYCTFEELDLKQNRPLLPAPGFEDHATKLYQEYWNKFMNTGGFWES